MKKLMKVLNWCINPMTKTKWSYDGDVNPFEHGGIWVRKNEKYPDGNVYEAVAIENNDNYDEIFLMYVEIDITDEELDRKAIEEYMDLAEGYSNEEFVCGCIYYYGGSQLSTQADTVLTEEEMIKELTKYEIFV